MTCKNCIHYDVCREFDETGTTEIKILNCKDFKDKTNFLELPCKVGDEIYNVWHDEDSNRSCITIYRVEDVSAKYIYFADDMIEHNKLGKNLFLDLNQARAKLITEIARTKFH